MSRGIEGETVTDGDIVGRIVYDECASEQDPRDCCNLGKMVCWHRRYNLGDDNERGHPKEFSTPDEFNEWWKENGDGGVILPLALLDHSGISMRIGGRGAFPEDYGGWDSGQVGWIYATAEQIRAEYKKKRISKKTRELVEKQLCQEVSTYDDWLRGEVYCYEVVRKKKCELGEEHEEFVDSCGGFVGDIDYVRKEMRAAIETAKKEAA